MNDLQKCQLEIFKQTIKVLDENNLQYYMIGGTLLGAVRHGGFIPWDDDIDIGMPRADYEKFAKIANQILPEDLFYQDKLTDKEYPYNFAKIRKNDTLFKQKHLARFNIHHGVFIDIFPLDGCANDEKTQKRHAKKCIFINYISIVDSLVDSETTQNFTKKLEIFVLKCLRKLIGKKRVDSILYKNMTKFDYNSANYIGNMLGVAREREIMPKEYYFDNSNKYKLLQFEDTKCKCPVNPEACLTKQYGDFMQLPPEEKRVSHHQIVESKY